VGIRLFVMDVDGTLTDGKIYIGHDGEFIKAFHVRDGQGLALLRQRGILTAIITGRISEIVERRAAELKIDRVFQGIGDKLTVLKALCADLGVSPEETAYIGDDLPDLPVMTYVGVGMCPADAAAEVRLAAKLVLPSRGGEGAVRDAVEWILKDNETETE
jgi:3-deoxy-D-manno-octulosonate 8-phosphate phosphatase, YrbI family